MHIYSLMYGPGEILVRERNAMIFLHLLCSYSDSSATFIVVVAVRSLSGVQVFVTPCTVALKSLSSFSLLQVSQIHVH